MDETFFYVYWQLSDRGQPPDKVILSFHYSEQVFLCRKLSHSASQPSLLIWNLGRIYRTHCQVTCARFYLLSHRALEISNLITNCVCSFE